MNKNLILEYNKNIQDKRKTQLRKNKNERGSYYVSRI